MPIMSGSLSSGNISTWCTQPRSHRGRRGDGRAFQHRAWYKLCRVHQHSFDACSCQRDVLAKFPALDAAQAVLKLLPLALVASLVTHRLIAAPEDDKHEPSIAGLVDEPRVVVRVRPLVAVCHLAVVASLQLLGSGEALCRPALSPSEMLWIRRRTG